MKIFIAIILLFLTLTPASSTVPQNSRTQSLLNNLNSLEKNDSARLKILYKLVQATYSSSDNEVKYTEILLKEATEQRNNKYICLAYWSEIIIAYNNYDYNAAVEWHKKLEPLARQEHLYDLMFQSKMAVIEMLSINEEYEKQEYESRNAFKEASELNHKLGMVLAKQSLANVCIETFRYQEAATILEEAYEIFRNEVETTRLIKNEILFSLISAYRTLNDLPNLHKYILEYGNLTKSYIKKYPTNLSILMRNYTFLTDYNIRVNNKTLASQYIDSVHKYYSPKYSDMVKNIYHECCYYYYEYIGEYEEGIKHIDESIKLTTNSFSKNYYTDFLIKRAELLRKLGRPNEAAIWYEIGITKMDSIRLVKITKQEEYLKGKFDTQNYILESNTINNYHNRVIIISILVIVIILVGFIYYTFKIRCQLKKDEAEMRVMTDNMEIANKAKDNFLNNIGKSISVPLNYIVENSQRLGFDEQLSSDDKKDLSIALRKNSSKLMAMINDILDFSRLEAGMMKLTKEPKHIIRLINDTISEQTHMNGTKINVSWKLSLDEESYIANVDMFRFQESIRSLLKSEKTTSSISISITDIEDEYKLYITFNNSWLSVNCSNQDVIIRNEINRLMMEQFGGTYNIDSTTNTILIVIECIK